MRFTMVVMTHATEPGFCTEKPELIDEIADAIESRDHVFDPVRGLSNAETEKLADLLLRCVNREKTRYARRAYRRHAEDALLSLPVPRILS